MTKSSSKRAQPLFKQKDRPSQKKDKQDWTQKQVSKKIRARGPYLRSKAKLQIQKICKIEDQEVKIQQSQHDGIQSSYKSYDDFGLKLNYKIQDASMKKGQGKNHSQIFYAQKFEQIQEEDLLIYLKTLCQLKMSGVIIANELGKIIYSDKMGHELFQGSLNKFGTLKLQNLLLKTLRWQSLQQLKQIKIYNENTILKWIIYSKNNKRRYSNVPFDSNNNSLFDIYFRFLKCLTIRIRPIKISISKFNLFQGLWNHHNIDPSSAQECFMLEVRHSNQIPDLDKEDILNDPILQKYIKSNKKKLLKLQSQGILQSPVKGRNNDGFTQESIQSSSSISIQKKLSEHYQNMENKYGGGNMKSGKQQQRKNGCLKQPYGVCLITEIFFDEE